MTEILYGQQHAKTLYDYVIDRGISTLVLAQSHRQVFPLGLNFVDQLLKYQPNFELSIVPILAEQSRQPFFHDTHSFLNLREILFVLATTVISIVIASLGEKYLGIEELSVIFITAVVFVASRTRMLAAVFSALLFFLAYNFFFISPKFTLQISAHQGVITVVAFFRSSIDFPSFSFTT